jgi:prepilin-type N-terminal cleavage/methylation domain-containing protein
MNSKGFTLVELMIAVAIGGILLAIGVGAVIGAVTGNSVIPNKQSCMNAGGKWSEGIQYGRMTQLCTYN